MEKARHRAVIKALPIDELLRTKVDRRVALLAPLAIALGLGVTACGTEGTPSAEFSFPQSNLDPAVLDLATLLPVYKNNSPKTAVRASDLLAQGLPKDAILTSVTFDPTAARGLNIAPSGAPNIPMLEINGMLVPLGSLPPEIQKEVAEKLNGGLTLMPQSTRRVTVEGDLTRLMKKGFLGVSAAPTDFKSGFVLADADGNEILVSRESDASLTVTGLYGGGEQGVFVMTTIRGKDYFGCVPSSLVHSQSPLRANPNKHTLYRHGPEVGIFSDIAPGMKDFMTNVKQISLKDAEDLYGKILTDKETINLFGMQIEPLGIQVYSNRERKEGSSYQALCAVRNNEGKLLGTVMILKDGAIRVIPSGMASAYLEGTPNAAGLQTFINTIVRGYKQSAEGASITVKTLFAQQNNKGERAYITTNLAELISQSRLGHDERELLFQRMAQQGYIPRQHTLFGYLARNPGLIAGISVAGALNLGEYARYFYAGSCSDGPSCFAMAMTDLVQSTNQLVDHSIPEYGYGELDVETVREQTPNGITFITFTGGMWDQLKSSNRPFEFFLEIGKEESLKNLVGQIAIQTSGQVNDNVEREVEVAVTQEGEKKNTVFTPVSIGDAVGFVVLDLINNRVRSESQIKPDSLKSAIQTQFTNAVKELADPGLKEIPRFFNDGKQVYRFTIREKDKFNGQTSEFTVYLTAVNGVIYSGYTAQAISQS